MADALNPWQYPNKLIARDSHDAREALKVQRQMPGAQVMPASEPAPDLQDYRIHILLSTLMLVAGLLIANLQ